MHPVGKISKALKYVHVKEVHSGFYYYYEEEANCFNILNFLQSFQGETEPASFSWIFEEIKEVHKRWWQLRDNAVEIFLTNGRTLLLAFDNTKVGMLDDYT